MATHARQQYFADESSLSKEKREFSIADEVQQKIDSVEEWAQVNRIETVKVNWTALVPDVNKAVNVEVPDVIDNLYSTSTDDALSAKQWKVLYDYLQNIASRWRFLSNWNCATGLPVTNPTENPYPYKAWDYYSVSNVASWWGTNYRPDGSSYIIWQASTTVETDTVAVSDFYLYDGTNWLLLTNSARQIAIDSSLSTTSTNPVENNVITNALNWKHPWAISNVAPSNPVEWMLWYDTTNDQLKVYDWTNWNVTGKEYNAGEWIEIWTYKDYSAMQWPAPDGFHIPLQSEWQAVYNVWTTLWGWGTDWTNFGIALKLPFAGVRSYSTSSITSRNSYGYYWSSLRSGTANAYDLRLNSTILNPSYTDYKASWCSVRSFKDTPVVPTSSWTKLYWTSIESWWIFWSSTEWLISLSSDWQTWITIADKNLWATTVWNSWDTLSEDNCWYYYQWWNNYWFPFTWTLTDTSTTQVDASTYWPWNYYSSSTFIKYAWSWDSTHNDNLRWWETWVVTIYNAITNTWVTSVNWNTGTVTVEEVPSWWTEWQVLTQTNNWPAWQNPTGGSEIVYATQAEYNALLPWALTDNKHYFIYDAWLPLTPPTDWMLAYYLLESDANDSKADFWATGTTYNASWVGTSSYTTLWGKTTATFNNSDYINTGITCGGYPLTIACMYYCSTQSGYKTVMWTPFSWNWAPVVAICYFNSNNYLWYGDSQTNDISLWWQSWRFTAIRIDANGNVKMNIDNTVLTATTTSFTINDTFYIWAWAGNKFNGWVKCVWIWNKSLSDAELQQYKDYLDSL